MYVVYKWFLDHLNVSLQNYTFFCRIVLLLFLAMAKSNQLQLFLILIVIMLVFSSTNCLLRRLIEYLVI